ncbi:MULTISPECIES: UbiA family prenyltransferase [Methanobacterium]|jgi:4-hydroxybenzoate polyprenyltransferase|uniref:UbiA family prenyltransferase n=1 Tax=Methanobacterium veterum TaxID=408577 RepID=A0A9E5DMV8_9EURY|nr:MULTISPECIES: UbiA family prenyltransferase [Methanobacterium]MCZ3364503.1 UbiA family prenyltransferase [Methanobacterium veterum]MCZ3372256.1 UbiA family prenyltransferase [Methanobacterium veterum]
MIKTLIKSTRLSWASKNFNAYLLALTYAYFSGTLITNPFEILEGLLLVSVLWGALYSLNDLTDLEVDKKDYTKRNRAFIENKIDEKWILIFSSFLIVAVFIISLTTLNPLFTIILGLMLLNQLIYTLPPIRLKDTIFAPFTSTATNSVLRIASCCVLLGNVFLVPVSVYFFMYMAGMATYVMYKSKQISASIVGVIAGVSLIYVLYTGEMNIIQFTVAILPSFLAAIPLYISVYIDKEKMTQIADILYHQVAMVFFLIVILIILF